MGNVLLLGRNTGPLGNLPVTENKKWNPGHYGMVYSQIHRSSGNTAFGAMNVIQPYIGTGANTGIQYAGVAGLGLTCFWGYLESALNTYNFGNNTAVTGSTPDIDQTLTQLAALGKKFSLLLVLCGSGWNDTRYIPTYLQTTATYGNCDPGSSGYTPTSGVYGIAAGSAAAEVPNWNNANVMGRVQALIAALGQGVGFTNGFAGYDSNPTFDSIRIYSTDVLLGYAGTAIASNSGSVAWAAFQQILEWCLEYFPTTNVSIQGGFGTRMTPLAVWMGPNGVLSGCSDTAGATMWSPTNQPLGLVTNGGSNNWASPPSGTSGTMVDPFNGWEGRDYFAGTYPMQMQLPASGVVTATFSQNSTTVTFNRSVSESATTGTTVGPAPYVFANSMTTYLGIGGNWNNQWTPVSPALTTYSPSIMDIENQDLVGPKNAFPDIFLPADICSSLNTYYNAAYAFWWMMGGSYGPDNGVSAGDWATSVIPAIQATPLINISYPSVYGASPPLIITTASLPNATVGTSYSQNLVASGGSGTGYTWNVESAQPNSGLWLLCFPNGHLQGVPQTTEVESIVVRVTDSKGNTTTATLALTVAVSGSLSISVVTSGTVSNNGYYAYQLIAQGGLPPYAWSSSNAAQPWQVTLDGWVEGTPTSTGAVSLNVSCTDAAGTVASGTVNLSVSSTGCIACVDNLNSCLLLPPVQAGNAYQHQLLSYSGSGNWSVTGNPSWLSCSAGGLLTGTPTSAGNVELTVTQGSLSAFALMNVAASGKVTRPSYNTGSGFFIAGAKLYDPNGYPFKMRGLDRLHFNSAAWTSGTNGALSGANTVREFFGFGLSSLGENQTVAQMVTQITSEYADNDILTIVTVADIPSSFTASISGTTMTVTNVSNTISTGNAGIITLGMQIFGAGIGTIPSPTVVSQSSGPSGGVGATVGVPAVFVISLNQGTIGSEAMTGTGGTSSNADPNTVVGATNMLVYAAQNGMLAVQNDIMINVVNEWGASPLTGGTYATWQSAYETSISALRAAGFTCPILIDALDEGQDYGGFTGGYAAAILASDTLQNVMFSFHFYQATNCLLPISSVATGSSTTLTSNSQVTPNPFANSGSANHGLSQAYVTGVTGTLASINGQALSVNSYGGSKGAWTVNVAFNSTGLTYGAGGVVFDYFYYLLRAQTAAGFVANGIACMVGEFGPPGLDNTTCSIGDLITAFEAYGLGWCYWAWDDNNLGGDQTSWSGWFGMTGAQNTSYTNGQYVPSVPSCLTAPGMDTGLNPRYSLIALGSPAAVFV